MKAKLKKFIPLLLSVVMCGSLLAGCTENTETPSGTHTSHVYVYTDKDANSHTKTCSGCSEVNETEAHRYTDATDTTCNDCGHVRTIEGGTHTTHDYVYTDKDENGHTKTCSGCSEINEVESHHYTDASDATCNDCGHVRTVGGTHTSHDYVYTDKNDTHHTKTCSGCSEVNVDEEHTYTDATDTTCNDCGHVRTVGSTHTSHDYVYTDKNDTHHTKTCSGCSEVNVDEEHTYTDATDTTCNDCGHVRTVSGGNQGGGDVTYEPLPANNKIFLVGDSTVCSFNDASYYMPRYGYGTQIAEYFNVTSSQVVNLAASGRSSYSLMIESASNYATLTSDTDGLKSGDYLIIGFGHNDEKAEVARYADPTLASDNDTTKIGTYDVGRAVSFKYILKTYYIDVALSKGATPILCTPISRLFSDSDAEKGKYDKDHTTENKDVDVNGTTVRFTGGDYAEAIRELGEELNVTVVDLKTLTSTEYQTLGYAEASKYHAATGAEWADESKTAKQATGIDGTHTNYFGARNNAYYLANAILSSSSELRNHVKENISKPTYAEFGEAAVNSKYEIIEKDSFNPETDASAKWTAVTGSITDKTTSTEYKWYGTAFGSSVSSGITIAQGSDENGITFTITAASSKGKIASGYDDLAAVFIQVPLETAFKISATANASGISGAQSGYGIMIRDDIYIDDHLAQVASNYLTAGCYTASGGANINYWRINGALGKQKTIATADSNGTHNLSVTRLSQNTTLTFDTDSHKMLEDTYNLDLSDGKYVYICLWATRDMSVTFSNIQFETLEWEQA